MILRSHLKGETKRFDYVANAVAFYYGCAAAEMWKGPVERAVGMISETRAGRG